MGQKNNLIQSIRNEARNEAEKDFAADWGTFWKVAGSYIGQYIMAIVGFAADFAVAFSMLYGATRHTFASFLGAGAICIIIQYGYGGATFRITKAIKTGKITEGRYMRSGIIGGAFGLAALGASLYLSFNFDSVFRVASEPQAKKEMKDEGAVNAYYDDKIATLRNDYDTERNELQRKRNELRNNRTSSGEIMWTSRVTVRDIDTKLLPTLRATYDSNVTALEKERAQRLQEAIAGNAATSQKWDAKILQGAMFTRWFNISVNLLRVLLIIGYAVFLLDVYEDESDKREVAKLAVPLSPIPVSFPPVAEPQRNDKNAVSNSAQPVNLNGVAKQLERVKAKRRAYMSKLRNGIGDPETNQSGLAECETEIERLEAILAGQKTS